MFAVGDVVVCVDATPHPKAGGKCSVAVGRTYRVTAIGRGVRLGEPTTALFLKGVETPFDGLASWRFRKIQKADDQFIEQVRACRPKRRERIEARRAETGNTGSVHESRAEGLAQTTPRHPKTRAGEKA